MLIQLVWGGILASAFPTNSQVMPVLLALGSHPDQEICKSPQEINYKSKIKKKIPGTLISLPLSRQPVLVVDNV